MKKLALALLVAAGISQSAFGQSDFATPNMITCTNGDNVELEYTTTNNIGQANVTLDFEGMNYNTSVVYTTKTVMGSIVTISDPYIADASIDYSLILPNITLGRVVDDYTFETKLVRTFSGQNLMGRPMPGIQNRNTFINVTCKAQMVLF